MAPSPRDGMQPIEFTDPAYLRDPRARPRHHGHRDEHARPPGSRDLPGQPPQTWYHWGELWLAAAVITITGQHPLAARYLIVLPVLLLAAAALSGTLVRRMSGTASRRAYLFGLLACLFLAPVPLLPGPFFGTWAAGLLFMITVYGLAAVAVLLALYGLAVLGGRQATWALAVFAGSAVALILPAHIVIALLGLVGVGFVAGDPHRALAADDAPPTGPLTGLAAHWSSPPPSPSSRPSSRACSPGMAWVAAGACPRRLPFNASWRDSIAIVLLGAGVFFAIPLAWFLTRKDALLLPDLYLGTMVLLLVGAIAWGARLA